MGKTKIQESRLIKQVFTEHRNGFYKSHNGRTIYCGKLTATPEELLATYNMKCGLLDAGKAAKPVSGLTYKELLSLFLDRCAARVNAKKRPLSARTLHNYAVDLNKFGDHVKGNTLIDRIGPEQFSSYAAKFHGSKSSTFESVVNRVGTLFRWAVEMEYLDRYRPGPSFQRPTKQELRDERIDRTRAFTAEEVCRLYCAAPLVWRCFIGLGICAAFNNSDVSNVTRTAIDLDAGLVDFRRRKTGKVRRVCPLPAWVVSDLRAYKRPEPAHGDWHDYFFLTRNGHPYSRSRKTDGKPTDAISRLFPTLIEAAGVPVVYGRNFAGLRTTCSNLAPAGFRDEVEMILGHTRGSILTDHYLESIPFERLRIVVDSIWSQVSAIRLREA